MLCKIGNSCETERREVVFVNCEGDQDEEEMK